MECRSSATLTFQITCYILNQDAVFLLRLLVLFSSTCINICTESSNEVNTVMKAVILICGKARSGKDLFAQCLWSEMINDGQRPLILHYADILKYFCKQYLGWNGEKDEAGRTLLQHFGTEVVRNNSENCWVNIVKELVKGVHTEYDYVLIPDTRFPNETDWSDTEFEFRTIRVTRPNVDKNMQLTAEQQQHASEIALDNFITDVTIPNDKDVAHLGDMATDLYFNYIKKI